MTLQSPYFTTAEAARYLRHASRGAVLTTMRRGKLKAAGKRGRTLLFDSPPPLERGR